MILLLLLLAQTPVKVANTFPTSQAVAARCVNAAGTAFEACGGAGVPRVVTTASNTGACVSVTASTTVLASNGNRKVYGLKAHEANTALVHCKLGATATTANMPYGAGSGWSQETGAVYTGAVDCIAASGTQTVCVYELE